MQHKRETSVQPNQPLTKRNILNSESGETKEDQAKRKRTGLSDLSNAITASLRISGSNGEEDQKSSGVGSSHDIRQGSDENVQLQSKLNPDFVLKEEIEISSEMDPEHPDLLQVPSVVKIIDPCPEFDYDATCFDDPFQVAEYANDIFKYYAFREKKFKAVNYAVRHHAFLKVKRAKIIDWLVKVQEDFELNHEVLYHAVKIFDRFLMATEDEKEFNFLGATSLIIAAKVDVQDPPSIEDFSVFRNLPNKCSLFKAYERKVLKALNFELNFPISYRFLRRYSKVIQLDMPTLTFARFVLETSLLFYEFIAVPDSVIAAASLHLALTTVEAPPWGPKLEKYSGYTAQYLEPLMWRLNHMMNRRSRVLPECMCIQTKYKHSIFFRVADTPLIPDRRPKGEPIGPPKPFIFHMQ